jgi:hypothetical protein
MAHFGKTILSRRTQRSWFTPAAVAAVLASLAQPALGRDVVKSMELEPFNLSLGAYFVTRTNGSIRPDRTAGVASIGTRTAPLPVIGFRLGYAFTPKWWMRSKYELFFLDSVDQYKGALSDFTIAIEHHTFQHVGFGFGLNRSSLDVEVDNATKRGAFSSVLNGLMLYAVVR